MKSSEIRETYLKFFEARGHKRIDPAPLVPEDGTTLFVTAGMQPLVPYLLGEPHPEGKRLVSIQPCLRTDDIDEVGDNSHNTFLEMMGNWSLGDYWKEDSLKWSLEFLTQELNLPKEKLAVTVFAGDSDAPRDNESIEIWKSLGIPEEKIFPLSKKENWWGPVGNSGPCGSDSEIFFWTGKGETKDSPDTNPLWVEVWNNVFMEYNKKEDGTFEQLDQKNVDTGIGVERTTTVVQDKANVYETDLFEEIIKAIELVSNKSYSEEANQISMRIIADHMRAAVFMIEAGIVPGNKLQGYILRRLLRRSAVKLRQLNADLYLTGTLLSVAYSVVETYESTDFNDERGWKYENVVEDEIKKFENTLEKGLREFEKIEEINGKIAFDLYQTYGFPLELTEELAKDRGLEVDKDEFYSEFEKHKDLSRTASAGMFKGGLASTGETETKYHTATHLLHAALRKVLGEHVIQRGSNNTTERLRFDFSHDEKLTDDELKEVENLINEQIERGVDVVREEMTKDDAEKSGAIGAFGQKYGDQVTVYTINPSTSSGPPFSREFCGGPHVANTREIGHVTITKEESAGAGIRRIYARID